MTFIRIAKKKKKKKQQSKNKSGQQGQQGLPTVTRNVLTNATGIIIISCQPREFTSACVFRQHRRFESRPVFAGPRVFIDPQCLLPSTDSSARSPVRYLELESAFRRLEGKASC